jgi:hypothetical protein
MSKSDLPRAITHPLAR